MKRRPSSRSWLRTAQRWYSSAQCAADRNLDRLTQVADRFGKVFGGKPFSTGAAADQTLELRCRCAGSAARSGQIGTW